MISGSGAKLSGFAFRARLRRSIRRIAGIRTGTTVFLGSVLGAGLLSEWLCSFHAPEWLRFLTREMQAACRDPGTQWMVVACLVVYLVTFQVLSTRVGIPESKAARWFLFGLVGIALLRYAFAYDSAAGSLQFTVLLAGMVFGKAVAFFCLKSKALSSKPEVRHLTLPASAVEAVSARSSSALFFLLLLLATAALWQPEMGTEFKYRGIKRWSGAWSNPNTYGLLMGTGVVLAVGLLWQVSRGAFQVSGETCQEENVASRSTRYLALPLLVAAGSLCSFGLLKSYSRGAWLGTAVGLGFLAYQVLSCQVAGGRCVAWLHRNRIGLATLVLSLAVISFWWFRHTELPVARRVFSVANVNDFSWRNRVTAWSGSLAMLRDHPWIGVGWGQVEKTFADSYRDERLAEAMAVQLNDYFTLANSAGLPALVCFLAYVGFTLTRSVACGVRSPAVGDKFASRVTRHLAHSTVCFAVVILLLIGFWFDGGLFKLALAVVFWPLLELARVSSVATVDLGAPASRRPVAAGWGRAGGTRALPTLSWSAAVLFASALGLSAFHVLLPCLTITNRTLSLARRYSVTPSAIGDFDSIGALPVWQGQQVRTLLEHVELSHYNRDLVNWQVSDEMYREFVLNPVIDPALTNELHWRRNLWEYFYPRIRKEPTTASAAGSVIRQLRERVRVSTATTGEPDFSRAWYGKEVSKQEFQLLCVAALRSVGVPARVNPVGESEFHDGTSWKPVSSP